MVNIDDYLAWTSSMAIYPGVDTGNKDELTYLALGLGGEAGEVLEKTKKMLRDTTYDAAAMRAELGDVFWYLVRLCKAHGYLPSEVLEANVQKLTDRQRRGTISGSGDAR